MAKMVLLRAIGQLSAMKSLVVAGRCRRCGFECGEWSA